MQDAKRMYSQSLPIELKQRVRQASCFNAQIIKQQSLEQDIKEFFLPIFEQKQSSLSDAQKEYLLFEVIVTFPFTQLRSLDLHNFGITSLEPIVSLDAPVLITLCLHENKIVSFKPLAKCKFILQQLYIQSKVAQFDQLFHLCRTKLPSKMYPITGIQSKEQGSIRGIGKIRTLLIQFFIKAQPCQPVNPEPNIKNTKIQTIFFIKYLEKFGLVQYQKE